MSSLDDTDGSDLAGVPDDDPVSFSALGLRAELLAALARLGYEEPTAIQQAAIPPLLEGRDLLGQAATGTGKTAAFALPVLHRLGPCQGSSPARALVLVPTRELAVQVSEAMYKYGRDLGARVVPVYGGQPIGRQLQALARGVDVVVATPGRVLDHIKRGSLSLAEVDTVVLDEADEMLDMGFAEDLEAILDAVPAQRQTMLFSATMPSRLNGIVKRHLTDPVRIQTGKGRQQATDTPRITQRAYVVARAHKPAALGRILDVEAPVATIVFCRTREEVDQLTETMNGRGYRAEALHGGMDQEQRDRVMGRLRAGTAELLVATDVAARGLDIDQLSHVVNYDVPSAPESYVHRIGRVGRAGREGVAITLAEPREQRLLANIERVTGQPISVATVPSVADLRAKRVATTVELVRDALDDDDLDDYDELLELLLDDGEVDRIALAALKLVHLAAAGETDDQEIPEATAWGDRKGRGRGEGARERAESAGRPDAGEVGRVYVSIGFKEGVRPGDLVGAIANSTHLVGSQIGPIKVWEHYSVVGVPERSVDEVVRALKQCIIRGKKASVRRFVEHQR
jgi:ATP-dependent RNA helicase DeaD